MVQASENPERLEAIGSAAAGIAHDINNQLILIVNHISMKDSDRALAAVARCAALTRSLLDFSRGEPVPLQPLDPGVFLREFLASLQLPQGVRLVADIPVSLPAIAADALTLERALTNLVSNACAAMKNSGTLTISASARQIEIGDSGPGIPPDWATRIFEPFFTTKGPEGTGLGLAIVRDIMRRHRGSATVRSQPGSGAVFTLRFPAVTLKDQGVTAFKASPRRIAPAA